MKDTSLGYCGSVEIKTKTRSSRIHNNGTKHLFRLLTSFLAGDDVKTSTQLPAYIAMYNKSIDDFESDTEGDYKTSNNTIYSLIVGHYIPITTAQAFTTAESNAAYGTKFEGVIDYKSVTDVNDVSNITLALVSGNQENILAVVPFDTDAYNVIKEGGLATIFWNLTFENIPASETT